MTGRPGLEDMAGKHPVAARAAAELSKRFATADAEQVEKFLEAGDIDAFYKELGISRTEAEQLYAGLRTYTHDPVFAVEDIRRVKTGIQVLARYRVESNAWFLPAHFPGNPMMPGMLQLEALAEATAAGILTKPQNEDRVAVCVRVDDAKFKKIIRPNDELRLESTLSEMGDGFDHADVKISIGRTVAATASLTFHVNGAEMRNRSIPQPVAATQRSQTPKRPADVRKQESLKPDDFQMLLATQPPFVFVDAVTDLEPGVRVSARHRLRDSEWTLLLPASSSPTVPGMLQLEALAQTSAIGMRSRPGNETRIPLCARIKHAQFERIVLPGEELRLEADIEHVSRGVDRGFDRVTARGFIDDDLAVSAAMTLVFDRSQEMPSSRDIPQPELA